MLDLHLYGDRVLEAVAGNPRLRFGARFAPRSRHDDGRRRAQPNTVNNSCADGTAGGFHFDESIDCIKVSMLDGGMFASGKTVRIEVTLWAFSGGPDVTFADNRLDLYFTGNAASPAWTFLTTLTPATANLNTMSATYVLPAGGLQAVRANFRFGETAAVCAAGAFTDHDDLIFRVGNPVGDLNLDASTDLLWRNKVTGQNIGWLMDGLTVVIQSAVPGHDRGYQLQVLTHPAMPTRSRCSRRSAWSCTDGRARVFRRI